MKKTIIIIGGIILLVVVAGMIKFNLPDSDILVEKENGEIVSIDTISDDTPICDENGNVYASEQEAKDAGLAEAQYGATYCQYFEKTNEKTEVTTPDTEVNKITTPEVVPAEDFSKKEQTTGTKKHDDFILEHVKHNNQGSKYAISFQLSRKHTAKTHEAPYTIATYHAHNTTYNHGRIEVIIHEVDKNTFDPSKVIEPGHNKYVKDIMMKDSGYANRVLFVIHLDENATGKFSLSSKVENNQDATITLDILE